MRYRKSTNIQEKGPQNGVIEGKKCDEGYVALRRCV
ncbi:Uncharacterised protein [Metakosakonia massiliensis]|uniref:Uncharacterized protein n=1 Tax=Phytobacter massiliensis TaxID=1485952 RepID=A0A6N3CM16_9ENTR